MIAQMGGHLARSNPDFDVQAFTHKAIKGLDPLELKERSNHIRDALKQTLPGDFKRACETMIGSLHPIDDREKGNEMDGEGVAGWSIMPMAEFVAERGLDDIDTSFATLKELTKRFTAEFAIRPFFIHAPTETLDTFKTWSKDPNLHLRRLASEGSRPRLPWGLRLQAFVEDPEPILPILETLKDDTEEYVRRSVANNLNDIAKDHPDLVAEIAKAWLKDASKDRTRLVKHACRSLIKEGHKGTLEALGYGPVKIAVDLDLKTKKIRMGEPLEFSARLTSQAKTIQPLIIDYVLHHRKANGQTSPKVFKWKVAEIKPGQTLNLSKKHPIKPITTRVYYEGAQGVEVQVNGQSYGKAEFDLSL